MAATKCLLLTTVILLTGVWIAVTQAGSAGSSSSSSGSGEENAVAKCRRGRSVGQSRQNQRGGETRKSCPGRSWKPRKQKQYKKNKKRNKAQKKADVDRRKKPSNPAPKTQKLNSRASSNAGPPVRSSARKPGTKSSKPAAPKKNSEKNQRRETLKSTSGNRQRRTSDSLSTSGSSSVDKYQPKPDEKPEEPSTTVTPTEPGDPEGTPATDRGGDGEEETSAIGPEDGGDEEDVTPSEEEEGEDDESSDEKSEEIEDEEDEISTTVSTDTTVTEFIDTSDMVTIVTSGVQTTESPFCDIGPSPIRAMTQMDSCIIGEKNMNLKISCKAVEPLKCPELPSLPLVKFPQRKFDVNDFRSGQLNKTRNGRNGCHKDSSWYTLTFIVTSVVTYCHLM